MNNQFIRPSLLKEIFITSQIKEEVSIPVWPKRTFHLDFYIPITKIAVEVHGKQHYEFNVFFHANRMDFRMQENRDKDKIEWCSINGILLVISKKIWFSSHFFLLGFFP